MPDRILTTHAGSLPRPADLIELFTSNAPDDAVAARTTSAVAEVVVRLEFTRGTISRLSSSCPRERLPSRPSSNS